jgi:WS/DGAT/MGAT family acyltransferase
MGAGRQHAIERLTTRSASPGATGPLTAGRKPLTVNAISRRDWGVAIERLTPSDEIMLWPDEDWPQEIGALAILDGGPLFEPDGRLRIERVRRMIASRLHLVPRLRHLLHVPPRRLGGPVWIDDPAFDVAAHVNTMSVGAPGDEDAVLRAVEDIRRKRLDHARPLWELWLITGMPDHRVGMYVRIHHCVADGMAGVATLGAMLDLEPDAPIAQAEPWTPAPAPTDAELDADARRRRAVRRETPAALGHLLRELPALREIFLQRGLPSTSLDFRVGGGRRVALVRSSLEGLRAVAHANGATVNDVFLAAIAAGLRALLRSRGETVDGQIMRIYVPISLHSGERASARGNEITQMVVELPIGVSDPTARLRLIAAETARRKTRARPSVGAMPLHGLAGRALLKLIERQRVNVESADLPGPPVPLYLAGARLLDLFPLLPLFGSVSLGVGALSYAGQLNISVVADRDGYPDLDVFAAAVRDELQVLEATPPSAAVA